MTTVDKDARADSRPDMRADDPRARAEQRAAELRGHLGDMDEGTDDFYIDPKDVPDGWSYEWKRHTTLGQEDPAYQVQIARRGWTAVPADRHPSYMPDNGRFKTIDRKGMVLMERPQSISDEARDIELRKARNQVRQKEAQLNSVPEGQFERDDPRVRANVKKSYTPVEIPKD
jgi:hypothetical protein